MAVSFECPTCGKKLKAPESAIGKSLACPGCEAQVSCPEPIYEVEVVGTGDVNGSAADAHSGAPVVVNDRRPCPMCGEMILATAIKCRYCDEVFDQGLSKTHRLKSTRYHREEAKLDIEHFALAILCTGGALLLATYWMVRGDPRGLSLVKLAVYVIISVLLLYVAIGLLIALIQLIGTR